MLLEEHKEVLRLRHLIEGQLLAEPPSTAEALLPPEEDLD
jgi:hypothetical protein